MKKIIISLSAIITLLFTGCFIDSDTATVRINLGNIPVAKVEKKSIFDRIVKLFVKEAVAQEEVPGEYVRIVHLGAFDEANQLVAKKSISIGNFPDNTTVTFDVPAGIRRKIVVLGENYLDYIGYHGVSDEVDLNAGTVVTVPVNMNVLDEDYIGLSLWNYGIAEWDTVYGSSGFNIYSFPADSFIEFITTNNYEVSGNYYLRVYFGFINGESSRFTFYLS